MPFDNLRFPQALGKMAVMIPPAEISVDARVPGGVREVRTTRTAPSPARAQGETDECDSTATAVLRLA